MNIFSITSKSNIQTFQIAKSFAKYLSKGDTIVLTGELGSGKTKFTEGFLSYFGLEEEISSPTFNIVNEYINNSVNIYHFDVYRLSDIDEFYAIGGEEYFEKGICLVEWGEQIESALPYEYIKIFFQKVSDKNTRILDFKAIGEKYEKIIQDFATTLNAANI